MPEPTVDLVAALRRAVAMLPEACMAEAHRTTMCDSCTDSIAALRDLADQLERAHVGWRCPNCGAGTVQKEGQP